MGTKPNPVGMIDRELAAILNRVLSERGMSEAELARRAGLSQPTVHRMLAMKRPMSVDDLDLMCEALGLVTWMVVREAEQNLHRLRPVAPVSDLSALRARLEAGQVGDVAALDPGYSPEDEQDPDTP